MANEKRPGWLSSAIPFTDKALKCKHGGDLLPSGAFRAAVVGLSGTGKTRFLLSLLPLMNKCLGWVIVCSRVKENSIHDAIEEWCRGNDKQFFKATDDESAQSAIEIMVQGIADTRAAGSECMGLCIFDDFSSLRGRVNSSNDGYIDTTVQCFNFLRNYAVASVIVSQYSWSVPQRCMTSVNVIVVFRSSSKASLTGIDLIVGLFFEGRPYDFMACYRRFLMPKDCLHNFIVCNLERGEFHVIDFREDKDGLQVDLLDSMDRQTGEHLRGAGNLSKSLPGEIAAGNDSPETAVQNLMRQMKCGTVPEKTALDKINFIAKKNDLTRANLNYLWGITSAK